MTYSRVGRVMLAVHSQREPTDDEWNNFLKAFREAVQEHGVRRLFVVSAGGGPNAKQRHAQFIEVARGMSPQESKLFEDEIMVAICGSSAVVRGIMTALTWMTRGKLRFFAYDDRTAALSYLTLSGDEIRQVLGEAGRLVLELGRS